MGWGMSSRLFLAALGLALFAHFGQANAERLALVIGNARYPDADYLKTPVNDARDLSDELKRDGFNVAIGENLSHAAMKSALDGLYGRIKPGDAVLLFFAATASSPTARAT